MFGELADVMGDGGVNRMVGVVLLLGKHAMNLSDTMLAMIWEIAGKYFDEFLEYSGDMLVVCSALMLYIG